MVQLKVRRGYVGCIGSALLACTIGAGCTSDEGAGSNESGAGASGPGRVLPPAQMTVPAMNPVAMGAPPMTPPTGTAGIEAPATAGTGIGGSAGSAMMMMPAAGAVATAGSGGASSAGSGGMGSMMPATPPTIDECPEPPAGASAKALEAWTLVNQIRVAAGAGCMNLVLELAKSAQSHCDYVATNAGSAGCDVDSHSEAQGCPGFTGADVQAREIAAGYPKALAYTEVMNTFGNNPAGAVPNWIDTVYHRIPLLDPWTVDMGYGGAARCDTIDIGRGMSTMPADTIVVYPYDGQTNVPPTWNGLEGPAPPAPAGGWPSSYVINIFAQGIAVTEHVLTKDGDDTPLPHTFLDVNSPEIGGLKVYFRNTVFLYGAPFELNTKYRVKIVGTYKNGALNEEWTFTTGAKRPFGT